MKRFFLALLFGAPLSNHAAAQSPSSTEDVGRIVKLPAKMEHVCAAGPPACMLVLALAPDKLIGLQRLALPLYPNEFKYDLAKGIDSFYALFYLQKPSAGTDGPDSRQARANAKIDRSIWLAPT